MSETMIVTEQESLVVQDLSPELLVLTEEEFMIVSDTTVELLEIAEQGPPGPKGEAGQAGVNYLTYPANGAVSGHRVICLDVNSAANYADSNTVAHAVGVIGISMNAAASGDPVNVQGSGEMIEPTWAWTPNVRIFCGVDGVLTQTPPTTGFSLVIGVAISPTKIIVGVKSPIIL